MRTLRLSICFGLAAAVLTVSAGSAQSDLDALMQQVLSRRDEDWKKLQQYVLDERESAELRGPSNVVLWGQRSDYTWFIRDGFFVRSPVKVDGVTLSEADRRDYEVKFLRREQEREKQPRNADGGPPAAAPPADPAPADVDAFIRQTRQPQFITSAYFLRFKFDEGRYALVGRERLDDRDVLRIEYYPANLFTPERRREQLQERDRGRDRPTNDAVGQQMMLLMNKKSKVTLWVDPASQRILKYTFEDLGWNFLPGQWIVRMSSLDSSMTVFQAFPDVWLPRGLQMDIGLLFAIGPMNLHYTLDYHDYRRADVTSKIGVPDVR